MTSKKGRRKVGVDSLVAVLESTLRYDKQEEQDYCMRVSTSGAALYLSRTV